MCNISRLGAVNYSFNLDLTWQHDHGVRNWRDSRQWFLVSSSPQLRNTIRLFFSTSLISEIYGWGKLLKHNLAIVLLFCNVDDLGI